MSVGVQQMVEPRAAGVLFTLNPLNGDRSKIMVESSFGLGESVVGGEVDPDRWLVDKVTLEVVERTIATKSLEYRFDPEQGAVAAAPVPDERAREPSLTDPEVLELAKVGKRIERHHGTPRDIEWALVDGLGEASIQILQSRPETVWSQRQPDDPILGRKGSAVEYVLAELMDLGGVKPSQDPGAER
jgi:pyruvate,water dikinase